MTGVRWKHARPTQLPSVPRSRWSPCRSKIPACRQNGRKSPNFDTMVSHRGAIGSSPMANGDQPLGRQPARHDMLGGVRLRHGLRAPAAGVSGAPRHQRLELCRDHVEPLGEVLADPCHLAAAAGAERAGGLDHTLDPGQMCRQMTTVARRLARRLPARPLQRGLGLLLRGFEHALGQFGILQGQVELVGDSFPERLPNRSRCEEREACLPAGGWPPAPRPGGPSGGCSRG